MDLYTEEDPDEQAQCPQCGAPSDHDRYGTELLCHDCTEAKMERATPRWKKHFENPPM
jgi:ribosomal protein L37AE/L43A